MRGRYPGLVLSMVVGVVVLMFGQGSGHAQTISKPSDLYLLLPDGGGLLVLDGKRVAASPIGNSAEAQAKLNRLIEQLLSSVPDLGLKIADVNSGAVSVAAGGFKNPTIALNGKFTRTDLLARLKGEARIKLSSEKYKDLEIFNAVRVSETGTTTSQVSFVFYDENTLVLGTNVAVRGSVDAKSGSSPHIGANTKLAALMGLSQEAAVRFALLVTPEMAKSLNSTQLPLPDFSTVSAAFGSLDVGTGINVNATLRSDTPAHAKGIAQRLTGVIGIARSLLGADANNAALVEGLKSISVTTVESDVKITGSLPLSLLSAELK